MGPNGETHHKPSRSKMQLDSTDSRLTLHKRWGSGEREGINIYSSTYVSRTLT